MVRNLTLRSSRRLVTGTEGGSQYLSQLITDLIKTRERHAGQLSTGQFDTFGRDLVFIENLCFTRFGYGYSR